MAQDLDTLLKSLQALTQAAQQPGRLSRAQLEDEVGRMTVALRETLEELTRQLPAHLAPTSALLVEAVRSQLSGMLQQGGTDVAPTEKTQQLRQELELLKRGFIRS
ncbi:hypothetical protein [Corallococcus llansteffanensis]|uniref:Uncharacterized protein n=1 Tax=Corallococcus llansteffanensis TaxID=2316731 RepID=A0A3A8P0H1_9BACT|nr:hypothetical protein [Corallococcus llansteffanensis]RKH50077.1 hypothetical protein D7V93_30995 [Corallococcus llansteffanensis]